ncbi:thiamine/thiamine pyrophosphate ABC transporter permease ThiP [Rhizobium halophilum]|uniref:thiamine/thiamine pyrophosphate ABC transporter permease ThiP n=1 Tax=Rhizobium halophilum TaxID=2846852 RepID=UPI001EFD6700|nr:thiamine/thiamine pyrophosphate ABC transporter permease ThiP [Rhizobium halophilum]MCF6368945.1 thiamine/thiamine pyrophosphate ABC transporter permease ThiP [Rhizobium halophilum]
MLTPRERRLGVAGGAIALAAVLAFMMLALLALLAFPSAPPGGTIVTAYTWQILQFTLLQAALSTALSVLLAVPVALALARRPNFPLRTWILRLMVLPMGLPVLVVALGLIAVWGRQGVANSLLMILGMDQPISIYGLGGILLAHVFFNLPLACRLAVAALDRLPGEYWKLAGSLGMGPLSVLRFLEWPAIARVLPGISSLVFMLCATSFTIVLVLGGGPAATTLEVAIYQSLRFDFDPPRAIALSLLQVAVTASVLCLLGLIGSTDPTGSSSSAPSRRYDGTSLAARLWDALVVLLSVFFLLLPLAAIVIEGLQADLGRLLTSDAFIEAATSSAIIAVASAVLALSASTLLIRGRLAAIDSRRPGVAAVAYRQLLGASSLLVLLVPPVVLGTGWFLLLRPLGEVARFAPILIVAINALMALPFVMRVLEPTWEAHHARTTRLVASLGLRGFRKFWYVDRPILVKPAALALSFAMALSLGDLGAIALFGSNDLVTLPWLLYSRLSSYRTADADGLALILGMICLALTVTGTFHQTDRSRRAAD